MARSIPCILCVECVGQTTAGGGDSVTNPKLKAEIRHHLSGGGRGGDLEKKYFTVINCRHPKINRRCNFRVYLREGGG